MYERVLVPIDHSARSRQAARAALEIARRFKASVVVMHSVAPYSPHSVGEIRTRFVHQLTADEYNALARKKALAALDAVGRVAKEARVRCETELVENRDPAAAILDEARKRRASLIVMASSGRTGVERIFLGSVTREVLAGTDRPVLIHR